MSNAWGALAEESFDVQTLRAVVNIGAIRIFRKFGSSVVVISRALLTIRSLHLLTHLVQHLRQVADLTAAGACLSRVWKTSCSQHVFNYR